MESGKYAAPATAAAAVGQQRKCGNLNGVPVEKWLAKADKLCGAIRGNVKILSSKPHSV